MRESAILFQIGAHWVSADPKSYGANKPLGATAAELDSAYTKNADGLSLAICRVMAMAGYTGKGSGAVAVGFASRIIADSDYRPHWANVEAFRPEADALRDAYLARVAAVRSPVNVADLCTPESSWPSETLRAERGTFAPEGWRVAETDTPQ